MGILTNKIVFDGLSNLNAVTRFADSTATFFLSPLRYLSKGKTVQCINLIHPRTQNNVDIVFLNIVEERSWFRTLLSIVLILPCTIIGAIVKAPALLCSSRLRRRHASVAHREGMDSNLKDICELAIVMSNAILEPEHRIKTRPTTAIIRLDNKDALMQACRTLLQQVAKKGKDSAEATLAKHLAEGLRRNQGFDDSYQTILQGAIYLKSSNPPTEEMIKAVANAIYKKYTGYSIDTTQEEVLADMESDTDS